MTVIKAILFDSPLLFFRGIRRHVSRSLDGKGGASTQMLSNIEENSLRKSNLPMDLNIEEMKLEHQISKEYSTMYNLQPYNGGTTSTSNDTNIRKEGPDIGTEVKSVVESFQSMMEKEQDHRREKESSFFDFLSSSLSLEASSSSSEQNEVNRTKNQNSKESSKLENKENIPGLKKKGFSDSNEAIPSSSIRDKYLQKLQQKKKWALSKNKKAHEYQLDNNHNNNLTLPKQLPSSHSINIDAGDIDLQSHGTLLEPNINNNIRQNEIPPATIQMLAYIQSRKMNLYFTYENTEHNKLHLDNLLIGRASSSHAAAAKTSSSHSTLSSIFFPFLDGEGSHSQQGSFNHHFKNSTPNEKIMTMKKKHMEKRHYFPYEKEDLESDFGQEIMKRTKSTSPSSIMVVSNNVTLLEKCKEKGFFTVFFVHNTCNSINTTNNKNIYSDKEQNINTKEQNQNLEKPQFVYNIYHIDELQTCIEELNGISYTSNLQKLNRQL